MMIKSFQQFIKESEDLFIPRNLDGRVDKFFRNLQRKLDSCNGIWKEDLILEGMNIPSWFRIPENLKISGSLRLSNTNISELSKNLQCSSLYLFNCQNIKELPEGLHVENLIDLSNSSIEQLPKNLKCKNLWLYDCKNLKELPEGLQVNKLNIYDSIITKEYCERMKQEGKISYKTLYA